MKPLFLLTLTLGATTVALAQPARPLRGITTLFDAGGLGNRYFSDQIRSQIRRAGFEITRDRKRADATFTTSGLALSNGGFQGQMTIRGADNRLIWHTSLRRRPEESTMVFDRLGQKLRAAK